MAISVGSAKILDRLSCRKALSTPKKARVPLATPNENVPPEPFHNGWRPRRGRG